MHEQSNLRGGKGPEEEATEGRIGEKIWKHWTFAGQTDSRTDMIGENGNSYRITEIRSRDVRTLLFHFLYASSSFSNITAIVGINNKRNELKEATW